MSLVSVIIPTYNRFHKLLRAIQSVKTQTYANTEIIVIDDGSTEEAYQSYNFGELGVKYIRIAGSKKTLGYGCAAFARNEGFKHVTGTYIAFLDDDDMWLPNKLELQLAEMQRYGALMSCTEGYIATSSEELALPVKDNTKQYNSEHFWPTLQRIFQSKGFVLDWFPKLWTREFLSVHNCVITTSVILAKSVVDQVGPMKLIAYAEDYEYWMRCLDRTYCVYVSDPLFLYESK